MELKIFTLCAYLLVQTCAARTLRPKDVWVVHMIGGEDGVRAVVERRGFVYVGKLMEGVYHLEFQRQNCATPKAHRDALRRHPWVVWMKRVDNEKPWTVHGYNWEKDAGEAGVPESFWTQLEKALPFRWREYDEETQTYVERCKGSGCEPEENDELQAPVRAKQDGGVKNEASTEPPHENRQRGDKQEMSDDSTLPQDNGYDWGSKYDSSPDVDSEHITKQGRKGTSSSGSEGDVPESFWIQLDKALPYRWREYDEKTQTYVERCKGSGCEPEEESSQTIEQKIIDAMRRKYKVIHVDRKSDPEYESQTSEEGTDAKDAYPFKVTQIEREYYEKHGKWPPGYPGKDEFVHFSRQHPKHLQRRPAKSEDTGKPPAPVQVDQDDSVTEESTEPSPENRHIDDKQDTSEDFKLSEGFDRDSGSTYDGLGSPDTIADTYNTPKQAPEALLPDLPEQEVASDLRRTDSAASEVDVREDTQTGRAKAEPDVIIGSGVANPFSSLNAEDTATGGRLRESGRGLRYIRYGDLDDGEDREGSRDEDGEDREGSEDDDGKQGPTAIYGKQMRHGRTRHGHGEAWCTQKMAARYHHDVCEIDVVRKLMLRQDFCVCW